jgi:hypothetical protein
MNKKYSPLFSTRLMALLSFPCNSDGVGLYRKYNTDTARILIYNAWWFEAIMVFFVINFIGNIKRYQLWKKKNGLLCCSIYLGSLSFLRL